MKINKTIERLSVENEEFNEELELIKKMSYKIHYSIQILSIGLNLEEENLNVGKVK